MSGTVTWRYDATTEGWLRVLFLAGTSLLYGLQVLAAGGGLLLLGVLLVTGSWETRLVVAILALVGGPMSLLYLLPMLHDPAQRPTFYPAAADRRLSARRKAALGVATACLLVSAGWFALPLAAGVAAVGLVAGVGYVLVATRGSVAPDTATLEVGQRTFDLSRVVGYRTRRLGPHVLIRFAVPTGPGRFGGVPSHVLVPADRRDEVTAALDAVVAANGEREVEGRKPNPLVRAVSVGLAVLFVTAGVGGVVLVGGAVGWYVAAICGLFAVVFLSIAREG